MDEGRLGIGRVGVVVAMVAALLVVGYVLVAPPVTTILSTVGASVGNEAGGARNPGAGDVGGAPEQPIDDPAVGDTSGDQSGGDQTGGDESGETGVALTSITRPDLLVIKTGTLAVQVTAVDDALNEAGSIVRSLGGYAAGSDRTGDAGQPQATVTYRIPVASWEDAFARLRGLGQRVLAEHSQTEDVSAKAVDLGARITNLQATERALQTIMDRAGVIKDVLSVQHELTTVRGQIEELTAEKSHLEDQAAFSTLEVTFSVKAPDPVKVEQAGFDPSGEVDRASASLIGILQDAAVVGIWFGIVWLPILIVLGIAGGIAFFIVRRLRGSAPDDGSPIHPSAEASA
jgi:Domain of unknown function (DUF4349)